MPPTARETSGVTVQLALGHVLDRAGDGAVDAVLERAQLPYTRAQLESAATWIAYDERLRLFEAVVDVLGDPHAMFAAGADALRRNVNQALIFALRALGTPRDVISQLPGAVGKFTTTSTMRLLEVGPTHAVIDYRLHDGYEHSRLDCEYAQGLMSVAPAVFGLPPARIRHDSCQSDGHPSCRYELSWTARSRLPWRRRREVERRREGELTTYRAQLAELQSATADLVSGEDLGVLLERVAARAAAAVVAQGHLLVVDDPAGGAPLVRAAGLEPERAQRLASQLLAGEDLGSSAIVADVVSARRHHGRLAAVYAEDQRGLSSESELLEAYARQAAAALDTCIALEEARRGKERAGAYLGLSPRLVACRSTAEVAAVLAETLPSILGASRSAVLLWDGAARRLVPAAASGAIDPAVLSEPQPALLEALQDPQPRLIAGPAAAPAFAELLDALGLERAALTPMLAENRLLAVAVTDWTGWDEPRAVEELKTRLAGVATHAVPALVNAELVAAAQHRSSHDSLTTLPNRELFLERARAVAATGARTAVLFCDLDRLKKVNDSLGHAAGDELLRRVAGRLAECVGEDDTVARLSGDEFAVLLPGAADEAQAQGVADRIVAALERPFEIGGHDLIVTVSVGVALDDRGGTDPDELLRQADEAMYEAKRRGRNQVARSTCPATSPDLSALWLEADLKAALDADALSVAYQPLVDLATGETTGYEALVRWAHPWRGELSPAAFVPLAEACGLAVKLDSFVLRQAARAAAGWHAQGRPLRVAVNLSRPTLADERFTEVLAGVLAETGLPPSGLELEVTENAVGNDLEAVLPRLHELKALGVRLALDDFGTGQSGIAWLHRFPVDRVKIDRSYATGYGADRVCTAVVDGIITLGRGLGLEILAEGVEDEPLRGRLLEAGCGFGQGWLFGRPQLVPAHTAPLQAVA